MKLSLNLVENRGLSNLFLSISFIFLFLMCVALVYGFPLPFLAKSLLRVKSLRKLFELFFGSLVLGILCHPDRRRILSSLKEKTGRLTRSKWAIWGMTGVYFLLFFWQQVTKYLALEMNFIPFLFYDYMLWFFDQGKFCYTGLLHGYYHVNLILLFLYPLWKAAPGPWVLHVISPLVVSLSAVPLYGWVREKFQNALLGFGVAFLYLNFRYVQNLLHANFVVEVFYPLFIFSAIYFAFKKREWLYYFSILLGLTVKEDSAIYFGALGAFFLFSPADRKRGGITLLLSMAYLVFIFNVFIPWSGSNILKGDVENYPGQGSTLGEIVKNVLGHPWYFIRELFWPLEKLRTLFKLTSKLLFFPLLSPWFVLVLVSIYPTFFQSTGRGDLFFQLSFYYVAAVLPFLFLAFADGWQRIQKKSFMRKSPALGWGILTVLVFLNAMNLRPIHFTKEDLKSIQLAKSLPRESVVVTQGHLLPYVGYRRWNFYLSRQYELRKDTQEAYLNPDYYLFDLQANSYPLSQEELSQKVEEVKKDSRFRLTYNDPRHFLFQRKM